MTNVFDVKIPEVKFNKNGYEVSTEIADELKPYLAEDFHTKMYGWEVSVKYDNGKIVSKVDMPYFAGKTQLLETSEKFFSYFNNKN